MKLRGKGFNAERQVAGALYPFCQRVSLGPCRAPKQWKIKRRLCAIPPKGLLLGGYSTDQEEFFFRWGIVSLLHDIGYPVEITYNQFRKFVDMMVNADGKNDAMPYLDYGNFNALNRIENLSKWEPQEGKGDAKQLPNNLVLVNLLSEKISEVYHLPYEKIKKVLISDYRDTQLSDNRPLVDHAFYSALVVLKWHGYLA